MSKPGSRREEKALQDAVGRNPTAELVASMNADRLLQFQKKLGFGGDADFIEVPASSLPPGQMRDMCRRRQRLVPKEAAERDQPYFRHVLRTAALLRFTVPYNTPKVQRLPSPSTWVHSIEMLRKLAEYAVKVGKAESGQLFVNLTEEDLNAAVPRSIRWQLKPFFYYKSNGFFPDWPTLGLRGRTRQQFEGRQRKEPRVPSTPFQPFPDPFVAVLGKGCLEYVRILGPKLVRELNSFIARLEREPSRGRQADGLIGKMKARLPSTAVPSAFRLKSAKRRVPLEVFMRYLRVLQACHAFVVLLSTALRAGEGSGLRTSSLRARRSKELFLHGRDFKPAFQDEGRARAWPIVEVVAHAVEQQKKLRQGVMKLASLLGIRVEEHDALWITLIDKTRRKGGRENHRMQDVLFPLKNACQPWVLDLMGRDRSLNASRFRKTFARLIALAFVDAPKIIMDMFGHKAIETAIKYILADPELRLEITRVMNAQLVILGRETLAKAEKSRRADDRLSLANQTLKLTAGSDADVTAIGADSFMRLSTSAVCAKPRSEHGPCAGREGATDTSRCRAECPHRVEDTDATTEHDFKEAMTYLKLAMEVRDRYAAEMWRGQALNAIKRRPDMAARWKRHPVMRASERMGRSFNPGDQRREPFDLKERRSGVR